MPTTSLHDAVFTAGVRQLQQERHATLSHADLDQIEAQQDETSPIYLPTLIRELREARELIALLVETRR